ncbi:hypothetical protein Dimus_003471 [Dionaea muscipula]
MKKLNEAKAEDRMMLDKLGHPSSSRISPPIPPMSSDLGIFKVSGLSPVADRVGSQGELAEDEGGAVSLLRAPNSLVGVSGPPSLADVLGIVFSVKGPVLGSDSMVFHASSHGGDALLANVAQVSHVCSPMVTESMVEVPIGLAASVVADLAEATGVGPDGDGALVVVGQQLSATAGDQQPLPVAPVVVGISNVGGSAGSGQEGIVLAGSQSGVGEARLAHGRGLGGLNPLDGQTSWFAPLSDLMEDVFEDGLSPLGASDPDDRPSLQGGDGCRGCSD